MLNGDWYADDGEIAQGLFKTRTPCSGMCCGNPRKWYGERTRQELIADEDMQCQLEDIETIGYPDDWLQYDTFWEDLNGI